MGLKALLRRLALAAPVPTFVVVGYGGRSTAEYLPLDPRLELTESPRAANVLLIAGRLTGGLGPAALQVHEQISRPRVVVQVLPEGSEDALTAELFPDLVQLDAARDLVEAIVGLQRGLLIGTRRSSAPILPDVDSPAWRGVGPYGQGGKGMTGGVPFGRPLAGRGPDRDGLELDVLLVRLGPTFRALPPGLCLDLKVQGDVIQEAVVGENPFERAGDGGAPKSSVFRSALASPVPIAELELARARSHLRWLSGALRLHGLESLGLRVLGTAARLRPADAEPLRGLRRRLKGNPSLSWAAGGVGVIGPGDLEKLAGGPVARAGGLGCDVRSADAVYASLGFEPLLGEGSDARSRLFQRLDETIQAIELAERAGERTPELIGVVESPRGPMSPESVPSTGLLELLPGLLTGKEWQEAMTTIVSLDIDLEEAARSAADEAAV